MKKIETFAELMATHRWNSISLSDEMKRYGVPTSRSTIWNWKNGKSTPRYEVQYKCLEKIMGQDCRQFFKKEEK